MRYSIRHVTRYRYSTPVYLEQHVLRLKPASNATQHLENFHLEIEPQPQGSSAVVDVEGNDTLTVWFGELVDHFEFTSTSVVETLRTNPYDYIWLGPEQLPMTYAPGPAASLATFLAPPDYGPVRDLAEEVATLAGGNAQAFLARLASVLNQRYRQTTRETGAALPPSETMRAGEGSCRDLAMLFLAIARSQGFAGRFVSGYHAEHDDDPPFYPHAWAEVYVTGGGWRGFDPTTGLAVSDRHIAVAWSGLSEQAALVSGSWRGGASSSFVAELTIEELPAE